MLTPDTLTEIFNRLKYASHVVYDVETSGLEWTRCAPVGHVLTFGPAPSDTFYVPVRHAAGGNIPGAAPLTDKYGWDGKPSRFEEALLVLMNRPGLTVTGHHLNFDLKFLWRLGVREFDARFEDTMVNAALIDELQPKFSLSYCAENAGVQGKKGDMIIAHIRQKFPEATSDEMGHFWRLAGDDPAAVEYAEGDGATTWQLRTWQMRQIHAQELERVHDIESRLIPVLIRMSCEGIEIDEERLHELDVGVQAKLEAYKARFPDEFNVKSPLDVEKWCRDHGATDWPLTPKKGRPSFPEKWLVTHECGRQIVEVRKFQTLMSTFIAPMRDTHKVNGRVHADFHQLRNDEYGTVTGRLSCSGPNLQQVPKHNEELGRLFRAVFVPGEGMIWGSADYSQCEPRLLAIYSRCKVLLDDYRHNPKADSHTAVAEASGLPRHNAKQMNMSLINGAGINLMVNKFGLERSFAEQVWNKYFAACPEIGEFRKTASHIMRQNGYVNTLLGRRCRLKSPDKDYVAVNRILQGGNADIIKWKLVQLDTFLRSEGRPVHIMGNIHDSIDYRFTEEARPVYEQCLRWMEDFSFGPFRLDVPMRVDAGEGPNWAIATYGEPVPQPVEAAA